MATQFKHCLKELRIPFASWLRSEGAFTLGDRTRTAKRIILLVPDNAISKVVDEFEPFFKNKTLIHFSATLRDPRVLGFHPLGSFTREQDLDFAVVHFHGEHPESLFREALPYLPNRYSQLSAEQMQRYHALCVLGGNFSAILWNAFFKEMKKIGVTESAAKSYFAMITENILRDHSKAVTGPLVRNDQPTLNKNLAALADAPELHAIYQAFVTSFAKSEYLT